MSVAVDFQSRLEQLNEDNAFVNVQEVLKQDSYSGEGTGSSFDNGSGSFLQGSSTRNNLPGKHFNDLYLRFNITTTLAEQHRGYTIWVSSLSWRKRARSSDPARSGNRLEEDLVQGSWCGLRVPHSMKGCRGEFYRCRRLLERWKSKMLEEPQCSSKSVDNSFLTIMDEYFSRCPSFEALTVPSISRMLGSPLVEETGKSHYDVKRRGAIRSAFIPLGVKNHRICSVCLLPAKYCCTRCRTAHFCSGECFALHESTRCLKYMV